jgi:heat shock protein HspQ
MFSSTFCQRLSTATIQSTRTASSGPAAGKQRVSLALYRQLLRWCAETDEDIPLSFFIPPVYMKEPQIDLDGLAALSDKERLFFPSNSILETNHITCPIHNSEDARKFFRAVFRVNRGSTEDSQVQKQRVTLAFDGIRSLNTLSQGLHGLKQNRAKHILRDGVDFRVGQVVKHKIENWRGIIIAWCRVEPNRIGVDNKPTSLTKKQYDMDSEESVRYTVLLDSGDAHLHSSKRRETSNLSRADVHQNEIDLVKENRCVDGCHFRVFD